MLAGKTGSKGREGLLTFLSKTTINVLVTIMKEIIQEQIASEVKKEKSLYRLILHKTFLILTTSVLLSGMFWME